MRRGKLFCAVFTIPLFIAGFIGCSGGSSGGGGGDPNVISGIITGGTNVIVGAFSSGYWFMCSFGGDEDVVAEEFNSGTTESFTPISTATVSSGTYSIMLPSDPESMGELIAWDDLDGDGEFDLGKEMGYFPVKNIEGYDYTISFWGYILDQYSIAYGSTPTNATLSTVGTDGYNFTLDHAYLQYISHATDWDGYGYGPVVTINIDDVLSYADSKSAFDWTILYINTYTNPAQLDFTSYGCIPAGDYFLRSEVSGTINLNDVDEDLVLKNAFTFSPGQTYTVATNDSETEPGLRTSQWE